MLRVLGIWTAMAAAGVFAGIPSGWEESFAAATNAAVEASAPMVFVFANEGCGICAKLEEAIESDEFAEWKEGAGAGYVYLFVRAKNRRETGVNAKSGAKAFARSAAGTIADDDDYLKAYPFVCLWWPKADGSFAVTNFTGTAEDMPVAATGRTLAGQFIASIENFAPLEDALSFGCGDAAGDRLEFESGTETIYVPFSRSGAWTATNAAVRVAVAWPDGEDGEYTLSFAVAATNAFLRLPVAGRWREGGQVAISAGGQVRRAQCVEAAPNSVANPYAPGEKAAGELTFGDWTLDAAAVRAGFAADPDGFFLAFYSGVQWCPYCKGMENSFLGTDGFREFLVANRVHLALYDQAKSEANGGGAQLLTFNAGTGQTSGAGYLSRHGLSGGEAAVKAALAETKELSEGAWLAPESTASRLSTPTMLLVGRNNQVLGRFAAWRDREGVFGDDVRYYDPAENIARLEDLLRLAGREDESSDYASTTKRIHEPGGESEAVFQINDRTECFIVRPGSAGVVSFAVAAPEAVRLELLQDGKTVAAGENKLSAALSSAGGLVLRLSAYQDYQTRRIAGKSSVFTARLTSVFEPAPAVNPYFGRKISASVMLSDAAGGLAGVATVKIAKSGRATVKIETAEGKTTFSGKLDSSGAATFVKNGAELALSLDAYGRLSVSRGDMDGQTDLSDQSVDFKPYQGYYTVAMIPPDGASGAGYTTLSVAAGGKVKVKAFLPDGKAFSASVAAAIADGALVVPVFKRTAKYSFAAAIEVLPDGAALWRDGDRLRLVESPGGAVWNGRTLDLFGGWYEAGTSEEEFREIFGLPAGRTVAIGGAASEANIKVNAKTGLFQGRAKFNGATGKIKGVLTPGWTDCGCGEDQTILPLGSGTFYYRRSGESFSLGVELR